MAQAKAFEPLLLYSATTWLAYQIARRYYNDQHHVWCTPYFDRSGQKIGVDSALLPSLSLLDQCRSLADAVDRGDRQSRIIEENRVGLLHGANAKRTEGSIGHREEREIVSVVAIAAVADFRPLLFVMPYCKVSHLLKDVAREDKIDPRSAEYVIEELPRACFDIIDWGRASER